MNHKHFIHSYSITKFKYYLFKSGTHGQRRMPGSLKLLLSGKLVCVCTYVHMCVHPQATKNHSCEMKPIKQVLLIFSFFYMNDTCYQYY